MSHRCWIAFAIVIGSACSSTATRNAVIPYAYLHRDSAPLGGPVDISLRFQVPPRAKPFTENCRVLMRLLFDDGKQMAAYDHEPPVATRDWQPGRTITYARRFFAPELPYVGDATLVVGLYTPSGRRLRLAGTEQGNRMYIVGTLKLHPRRTLLTLENGWRPLEGPDSEPRWRWTASHALVSFHNPRADSTLIVRADAPQDLFSAPPRASFAIAGRTVGSITIGSAEPADYELPVSAADLGDASETLLTIAVDKTFVPAKVGRGSETDERGIRVHHMFLGPRGSF